MAQADRRNYKSEYTYFLMPALIAKFGGTFEDYQIESLGRGYDVKLTRLRIDEKAKPEWETKLSAFLENHAVLSATVSKATLLPNDEDSALIRLDGTPFAFDIWLDGKPIGKGMADDGVLELTVDTKGLYTIEVKVGEQTGYVQVEADNGA